MLSVSFPADPATSGDPLAIPRYHTPILIPVDIVAGAPMYTTPPRRVSTPVLDPPRLPRVKPRRQPITPFTSPGTQPGITTNRCRVPPMQSVSFYRESGAFPDPATSGDPLAIPRYRTATLIIVDIVEGGSMYTTPPHRVPISTRVADSAQSTSSILRTETIAPITSPGTPP